MYYRNYNKNKQIMHRQWNRKMNVGIPKENKIFTRALKIKQGKIRAHRL